MAGRPESCFTSARVDFNGDKPRIVFVLSTEKTEATNNK